MASTAVKFPNFRVRLLTTTAVRVFSGTGGKFGEVIAPAPRKMDEHIFHGWTGFSEQFDLRA